MEDHIQKDTQEPALRQLAVRLMNQGVRIGRTPGRDADVLTLVGDTWRLDPEGLAALPYVLDVRRITPPYRLVGRAAHPENTVVEVGDARIGAAPGPVLPGRPDRGGVLPDRRTLRRGIPGADGRGSPAGQGCRSAAAAGRGIQAPDLALFLPGTGPGGHFHADGGRP